MDVTATGTDVSSPGLRDYLSGARLLGGTIAASALMLLACSWFALGTGVFGSSRDVARPDPVRIGGSTPAQAATRTKSDVAPVDTRRTDVAAPRAHRPGATSPRSARKGNESTAQSEATGPAPVPGQAKPAAAAPSTPSSPATSTPPQQTVVPVVEVTLPAPLDQVQVPPLPPVPVTPPVVPPVQLTVGPVSVGIP